MTSATPTTPLDLDALEAQISTCLHRQHHQPCDECDTLAALIAELRAARVALGSLRDDMHFIASTCHAGGLVNDRLDEIYERVQAGVAFKPLTPTTKGDPPNA